MCFEAYHLSLLLSLPFHGYVRVITGTGQMKRPAPEEPAFLVFLVGQGGVEPPTLGFSV